MTPTRLIVFLIFLLSILIPTSHLNAKEDACKPYRDWLKQSKQQSGHSPVGTKCYPLDICLNWDINAQLTLHSGYGPEKMHAKVQEHYPARMVVFRNQKSGAIDLVKIDGPSPQKKKLMSNKIESISGHFLVNTQSSKMVSYNKPEQFTAKQDPDIGVLSFEYNLIGGIQEGQLESPQITPKDNSGFKICSPDLDVVRVKGNKAITLKEIKTAIRNGEIKKHFIQKVATDFGYGGHRWDRTTNVEAKIIVGTLGYEVKGGRLNTPNKEMYCPNRVIYPNICYDIKVDCMDNQIKAVVPLELVVKEKDGKKVHPQDLQIMKAGWKKEIEEIWNGKYGLRSAGGSKVKIRIEVDFAGGPNVCHKINVFPGEGPTDAFNWYEMEPYGVIAHEFGHLLGLYDEYTDLEYCPIRPDPTDDNIMGEYGSTTTKPKHFEGFEKWMEGSSGSDWEVIPMK